MKVEILLAQAMLECSARNTIACPSTTDEWKQEGRQELSSALFGGCRRNHVILGNGAFAEASVEPTASGIAPVRQFNEHSHVWQSPDLSADTPLAIYSCALLVISLPFCALNARGK